MANQRWSASRFSCWESCRTKYKLCYIDELVVTGKEIAVQEKGLAFHQIAELMNSQMTLEELTKKAKEILNDTTFDQEKYPVIKAIPRFYMWWQEYVTKWEQEGYVVTKEAWEYSALEKKSIVGAIDVLLINETTKEAIIVDFKTGSTAKIAGYEDQLMLYAYMIKNRLKTKYNKIKTYLFFPLAGLKDEDLENPESTRKLMLKTFKQLIFTEDQVKEMLEHHKDIIQSSLKENWEQFDLEKNANMSYGCSWCDFLGHPTYCPASYKANFRFSRKCKVMTKEQLKEQEKNQ